MKDLVEFFGGLSLGLVVVLIAIYPLSLTIRYIKNENIKKYIKLLTNYIRKAHIYLALVTITSIIIHIILVSQNHLVFDLSYIMKSNYLFGYLAILTFIFADVTGIIFKYLKKQKYLIKLHIYTSIIMIILILIHIAD